MKRKSFIRKDEEGVSPVIATILMVAITVVLAAVLYIMVIGLAPTGTSVPTGVWGTKTVMSSGAVNVEFGKVSGDPKPMDIEIILVRNITTEGVEGEYSFASNLDGNLNFAGGIDIADIEYADLANNQKVNTGDVLKLTNLMTGSDYIIRMIWGPSGDQITSTTFSTP
ncbi:MAG: type IV pilin N-terminal domain-containing protein [Thermoplasmata archaeon]|nr:type IV pilin N-terminal domain-containing protein [Thermoplasmata archaeon]